MLKYNEIKNLESKYMGSYIRHLQELSTPLTFVRKINYIKYNLSRYFKKVGFKKMKVLEVGPGLGEFESFLNDRGVTNIDIVDNDKGILDYVSKKCKINKTILSRDISDINKKVGRYNFIFLMQVLEHLPINKYAFVIKSLYNHLDEKGFLIIVVPNANNPLGLIERYADIQHTGSFTEQSLKDLLNLSNIKNYMVEVRGYEIPPYDFLNLIRIFFQKILHFILFLIMIINGGIFFRTMTPNIMMVIKKEV